MTRYDRYFLWVFAQSLALVVALLATIYVVVDVLLNLDNFQKFGNLARDVTLYYAYNLPPILYLLFPLIVVAAGLFTLARIIRARELIVLQAAGVSPRRALASLFAGALVLGISGLALREFALPRLNEVQRESPIGASEFREGRRISVRDDAGNAWYVGRYDLNKNTLSNVRIISRDGSKVAAAAEMTWADARGEWYTPKGEVHDLGALLEGTPKPPAQFIGKPPVGNLLPADFARRKRGFSGTPLSELWQQARNQQDYRELGVALWHELWHPLSGLIMLAVAAGLVLARQSRMVFASALALCAILAYQICAFWFETLAVAGLMAPVAGAMVTPLAFALAGAALWRK